MALTTPAFERTSHLVALLAAAERLAALIGDLAPEATLATRSAANNLRDAAAIATLRLDGSTIARVPTGDEVAALLADSGTDDGEEATAPRRGTWLDALRTYLDLEDAPDERIRTLEFLGAQAGLASDDLAADLAEQPLDALRELQRRLTRGLVPPQDAGRLRASDQAVHDGATGRIIYYAVAPDRLEPETQFLAAWLTSAATREHAIVASGILHLELLRLHPFEAANGRLARTAARLALRGRGLDPHGLAVAEIALLRDRLGLYEEVARTHRRGDVTIWLERWAEAVTDGLRRAARELDLVDTVAPERALRFVADRDGFTVTDYRAEVGVGPAVMRDDLEALLDVGAVAHVPGSRGLRFQRRSDALDEPAHVG